MTTKKNWAAQRKFAQGASQPLHLSSSSFDKHKNESQQTKEEQVFHNNMPASQLLDTIAFQNIHRHIQPVVLLQRLDTETVAKPDCNQPKQRKKQSASSVRKNVKNKTLSTNLSDEADEEDRPLKFLKGLRVARKNLKRRASVPVLAPPKKSPRLSSLSNKDKKSTTVLNNRTTPKTRIQKRLRNVSSRVVKGKSRVRAAGLNKKRQKERRAPQDLYEFQPSDCSVSIEALPLYLSKKREEFKKNQGNSDGVAQESFSSFASISKLTGQSFLEHWLSSVQSSENSQSIQCFSCNLHTVRSVMDAGEENLNSRCRACQHCSRVDKLLELKTRLEQPEIIDITEEETPEHNISRPTASSGGEDRQLYLDVLSPDSAHIVRVTRAQIAHSEKKIVHARLVPKSMVSPGEVNLIEHEALLDQFLMDLTEPFKSDQTKDTYTEQFNKDMQFVTKNEVVDLDNVSSGPTPAEESSFSAMEGSKVPTIITFEESDMNPDDSKSKTQATVHTTSDVTTTGTTIAIPECLETPATVRSETPSVIAPVNAVKSLTIAAETSENVTIQTPSVLKSAAPSINVEAGTSTGISSIISSVPTEVNSHTFSPVTLNPVTTSNKQPIAVKTRQNRKAKPRLIQNKPRTRARLKTRAQTKGVNQSTSPSQEDSFNNTGLVDAPIFYPSEEEFADPITYFKKIMPEAAKFGICKVVAPNDFKPKCNLKQDIRFNVTNQYTSRLYNRWGPASREMCAIKAYVSTQNVVFERAPLLEGVEVNLPRLYHLVQHMGGLKKVIEKKKWGRVAEEMKVASSGRNIEKKLDQVYVKYLLPYDTLNNQERQQILSKVEKCWSKKNDKMMDRAMKPLHRQRRLLGESESSEDDSEDDEVSGALMEAEDCVVQGRRMYLATFQKIANNVMKMHFGEETKPSAQTVERVYWDLVLLGNEHVCVNCASIDTGAEGFGFVTNKDEPYGNHPWNLKMLNENTGNVLRNLGSVLGLTMPTLHLAMVFSTYCWHSDPHGLPWMEYMHSGPSKIWYGIPGEQSTNFRKAVEVLCPSYCQNKSIWLPSDIMMVPPNLLIDHKVSLSRIEQNPGEFIIVFPKAYSCSIATGLTLSESVYFATESWLDNVQQDFQEAVQSCEPTMFALEQLLIAVRNDKHIPNVVINKIHVALCSIIDAELQHRLAIAERGVPCRARSAAEKRPTDAWNVRGDECDVCRSTLYLSKVIITKKVSICLKDAIHMLDRLSSQQKKDVSTFELVTVFSAQELREIVNSIRK